MNPDIYDRKSLIFFEEKNIRALGSELCTCEFHCARKILNSTPWEKCVPTVYQNPLWETLKEISLTMMNPNIYGRESERSNESENQIRENII